jgi:1-acyl-sn-glycerol-3-phosphate acyltransferase
MEIAIMAIAAIGWLNHQLWLLVAAVVGMGLHSTLFGPVKYAYLPQHLKQEELVGGNGVVEMGTFVGILLGEVLGALLVTYKPGGIELVAGSTIAFAVAGWLFSRRIPHSPAPAPELKVNWNPASETIRNLRFTCQNRPVFLSVLGNSWFWFYGAVLLAQFPVYTKDYLHGDHRVFVLLLTIFSLGIGVGSLWCERLSGRKVEIGLVPLGAIGLSVCGFDLYLASIGYSNTTMLDVTGFLGQAGSVRILVDIALLGMFGGFYIVPLFALIQTRCDRKHMSRTIAGMNVMNALFMVVAALFAMVLLKMGCTIPQLFMATAVLNALVALCLFLLMPEFLMRFLAWLLIHTVYRVQTVNTERIPQNAAAILVCNHISYSDAIAIMAASPRPVRFVMDHRISRISLLSWIFKTAKAIPIVPAQQDPWLTEKDFLGIAQALREGDLVCIFPQGRLAESGDMQGFNEVIHQIVVRTSVPVIPMALHGRWANMFMLRGTGNPFDHFFLHGPFSRLSLAVGFPVAAEMASPEMLCEQMSALNGNWK